MSLDVVIRIFHVLGTVFGVGGVTMLTIFYIQSKRDGNVEPTEIVFLKIATKITNIGLWILIFSGLAFLLRTYMGDPDKFTIPARTMFKLVLTGVLLLNTVLLHKRILSAWVGGAISLSAWYGSMVLGLWRGMKFGYLELVIGYLIITLVAYLILFMFRRLYQIK